MPSQIYLIGDLARQTELSVDTLNYYLRIGLLEEVGRSPQNNYRFFDDGSVALLEKIKTLRLQKVSIKEILRRKNDGIL
jgi:DNA-binding transcriptional MerR regulator